VCESLIGDTLVILAEANWTALKTNLLFLLQKKTLLFHARLAYAENNAVQHTGAEVLSPGIVVMLDQRPTQGSQQTRPSRERRSLG